ncbi:MAG TPA: PAS domain S-box protein [Haliangium sp.]|nr:PAS domain S-box protein [Haliangium sp.]
MTQATDGSANRAPGTPARLIVGIGASAGGLDAFRELLGAQLAQPGAAFLLVQHLDPGHESILPELLAAHTTVPVVVAEHGIPLQADTVYVIAPGTDLGVEDGRLEVTAPSLYRGVHRPVDHLFRSLARIRGTRTAGIVLSGAGRDGTAGLRELKSAGGLAIAQQPETASQAGMPQSAIDAGVVDLVLPIVEMPAALARFAALPHVALAEAGDAADERALELPDDVLDRLAEILGSEDDLDVRRYKSATIERRTLRRMGLAGYDEIEPYLEHLRASPAERQSLVRDLLIGVTHFFRDPEAFEALSRLVISEIIATARPNDKIRVWVPGCATGEEAYSVAIALLEAMEAQPKKLGLQLFATDVDEDALQVARAGIYPASIAEQVTGVRLERFFTALPGRGFRVRPRLRDAISFAVHDLCGDPPFSRMDLISCRNVLIYLRPQAQEEVLRGLHFALEPTGYLFLGSSESIGALRDLYTVMSKPWRIFQRAGAARPVFPSRGNTAQARGGSAGRSIRALVRAQTTDISVAGQARDAILEARVPPSVVVSGEGRVLYVHGDLGSYLSYPRGEPRFDLLSDLRADLVTRVRAALYKCRRDGATVVVHSSPDARQAPPTRITATPAPQVGEDAAVLTFERSEGADAPVRPPMVESPEQESLIEQLERELQATREDLRNTVEELESANEELRTSNEESMSMNEELQSANEELEAMTEELRSLNEELATINSQLKEKVGQLEHAHDDLSNFFASTKLATLFLDDGLRIKRFTPAAEDLLLIDHDDLGRHVGDIARELLQTDLAQDVRVVLADLIPQSRDVETGDGRWLVRRVLPYRTETRRIEGVVVTWMEVTDLKRATEWLAIRERQQAVIARLGLRALSGEDLGVFMAQVVREVQQTLGSDFCEILQLRPESDELVLEAGVGWSEDILQTATVASGLDSYAGYTLASGEPVVVEDLGTEKRFSGSPLLLDHSVVSGLACVIQGGDAPYGVIGVHTRTRRVFGEDDANFLQAVANLLAAAIVRKQTRERLAVEGGVAKALSEGSGLSSQGKLPRLEDAMPQVMAVFARELGVTLGELWRPTAAGDVLERALFLAAEEPYRQAELERVFEAGRFRKGEGLPGRVWERGQAELLGDLGDERRFAHGKLARELDLLSGLAIPIAVGGAVFAVMVLFSKRRLIPDRMLVHGFEAIGRSLGEFVRRTEAERATRSSEERLRLAVEAASAVVFEADLRTKTLTSLQGVEHLLGEPVATPVPLAWWSERIHPEDRARLAGAMEQMVTEAQPPAVVEYRIRHRDGHYVFVEVHARVVHEDDGRLRRVGVVLDVSERKRVEAEARQATERLQESEASFRMLAESIPHLVWTAGASGTSDYYNQRMLGLVGRSLEDMCRPGAWLDSVDAADRAAAEAAWQQALATGGELRIDLRFRRAEDGVYLWHTVHAVPMRDQGGVVSRWFGTCTNIDERKQAEDRRRESELRLHRTFDSSPLGISFVRADGHITRCNDALLALLGYTREDCERGLDWMALVAPEYAVAERAALARLERGGQVGPAEKELVRRDGSRATVLVSAASIGVENEHVVFVVDLTQQKQARAALAQLAAIVESTDDAILSKSLDGVIQSWNRGAQELYGYEASEVVGKPVEIIVPPERKPELAMIMDHLRRGDRVPQQETVRLRKDGTRVDVAVTISPVKDERGRVIAASSVARDITERKRVEQALRDASEQKDQFLAILGHELRNPLAAIRGAAELLKLTHGGDPRLQRTQSILDRQTAHMAKLLDGLLDVSRIIRGKISLDVEQVDVCAVLRDLVQDYADQIERKGLAIQLELPPAPMWILGDRVRLGQIFGNLLANALQFTQAPGTITIAAETDEDMAVIAVRDTGSGIAPELLPHIFEPFRQGTQPIERTSGGLGLGLALVKGLVELHKGQVLAWSEGQGEGAVFTVRLPLTLGLGADIDRQRGRKGPKRVLVVEDNLDMAELLREMLARGGHDVAMAHNGPQALEVARELQPDLILCDIGLPGGMSGYDLAREIRNDSKLRRTFLVAITGYGRPEDRAEADAVGFDAHLVKPVSVAAIHELLARDEE